MNMKQPNAMQRSCLNTCKITYMNFTQIHKDHTFTKIIIIEMYNSTNIIVVSVFGKAEIVLKCNAYSTLVVRVQILLLILRISYLVDIYLNSQAFLCDVPVSL